jgi:Flp pilus assembly protein TadD
MKDAVRLTEAAPQVAEGWYARGVADSRLGRDAQAIGHYDHALKLRPELVYPRWARAVSYDRLHRPELAAADRRTADSLRVANAGCAACLDPFRY